MSAEARTERALSHSASGYKTPLCDAAGRGDIDEVGRILDEKASTGQLGSAKSKVGRAALLRACRNGHLDVVRELLRRGVEPDCFDLETHKTPLMICAAPSASIRIAQLLLDAKADLTAEDKKNGRTCLAWASLYGNELFVDLCLRAGAPIDRRDALGFTPLLHACAKGHITVARLLLQAGANPSLVDNKENLNALEHAIRYGCRKTAHVLVSFGSKLRNPIPCIQHCLDHCDVQMLEFILHVMGPDSDDRALMFGLESYAKLVLDMSPTDRWHVEPVIQNCIKLVQDYQARPGACAKKLIKLEQLLATLQQNKGHESKHDDNSSFLHPLYYSYSFNIDLAQDLRKVRIMFQRATSLSSESKESKEGKETCEEVHEMLFSHDSDSDQDDECTEGQLSAVLNEYWTNDTGKARGTLTGPQSERLVQLLQQDENLDRSLVQILAGVEEGCSILALERMIRVHHLAEKCRSLSCWILDTYPERVKESEVKGELKTCLLEILADNKEAICEVCLDPVEDPCQLLISGTRMESFADEFHEKDPGIEQLLFQLCLQATFVNEAARMFVLLDSESIGKIKKNALLALLNNDASRMKILVPFPAVNFPRQVSAFKATKMHESRNRLMEELLREDHPDELDESDLKRLWIHTWSQVQNKK